MEHARHVYNQELAAPQAEPALQPDQERQPSRGSLSAVLALQRSAGNRAIGMLAQRCVNNQPCDPGAQRQSNHSIKAATGWMLDRQDTIDESSDPNEMMSNIAKGWLHSKGLGHPIDASIQQEMGHRFGENFADVRVHTDVAAAATANAIKARAFTFRQDIVFGSGEYRPNTPEGKALLAHELIHTVQQRGLSSYIPERCSISQPNDAVETATDKIVRDGGGQIARAPNSTPAVLRTAVGFETTAGPTWSNRGQFEWIVKWHITNVLGAAIRPETRSGESWIVQRITNTAYNVRDCSGAAQTPPAHTRQYWEAFRINTAGRSFPGTYNYDFTGRGTPTAVTVSGTDQWRRSNKPANTKGNWAMEGVCYWVPALNAGEFTPRAVPDAARLPSTTVAPTGLGSPTLTRTAQGTWDSCGTTRSNDGEAAASNAWRTYTEGWGTRPGQRSKIVDGTRLI